MAGSARVGSLSVVSNVSPDLPPLAESVGAARRHASRVLDDLGLQRLRDDACTVVSELATNAVLHARSDFTVTLVLHERHVRIAVADRSPSRPRPSRLRDQAATTGRGLHMVAALSSGWGIEGRQPGKVVWCDLPLEPSALSLDADGDAEGSGLEDVDVDALLTKFDDAAALPPSARTDGTARCLATARAGTALSTVVMAGRVAA